ncbi:hypothetical protein NDU88_001632 [Pleurodeles waltl]|uniref:Uncharacterized protein n=1 Tax=Pleurodeles waltl TaxID=8319 RepID=A0AAV7T074_PLEWA|nr:hypothetical protein NDU88_001632 [Pleurodeles waltl]
MQVAIMSSQGLTNKNSVDTSNSRLPFHRHTWALGNSRVYSWALQSTCLSAQQSCVPAAHAEEGALSRTTAHRFRGTRRSSGGSCWANNCGMRLVPFLPRELNRALPWAEVRGSTGQRQVRAPGRHDNKFV